MGNKEKASTKNTFETSVNPPGLTNHASGGNELSINDSLMQANKIHSTQDTSITTPVKAEPEIPTTNTDLNNPTTNTDLNNPTTNTDLNTPTTNTDLNNSTLNTDSVSSTLNVESQIPSLSALTGLFP